MSTTPFTVDGRVPTGFELGDTRHDVLPGGLTSRRVETFPGSGTKFTILGEARAPQIVVAGYMRAGSRKDLYQLIKQYNEDAAESAVVTVQLAGETFQVCSFMGIQKTGTPRVFSDDGGETYKFMLQVQLIFEVLE